MTYLEIVNKVLKKLREDTVTTVGYNTYSSLIGEFVNDAKSEIENSWSWTVLRDDITFSPNIGDNDVLLHESSTEVDSGYTRRSSKLAYDSNNRPMAFCVTDNYNYQLTELSYEDFLSLRIPQDPSQSSTDPTEFALSKSNQEDGLVLSFIHDLEEARQYFAIFYTPQDELEDDDDELLIPWRPVVNLALLYALDERGEEIGEPGSKAWIRYERSLADEISIDATLSTHKIHFSIP
jgi:hypothetical protein